MSKLRGVATETIPFGALVLCRGFKVSLAEPALANGRAENCSRYLHNDREYKKGDFLFVIPVAGLGERDLHAMANAPLMDANTLFLPAGKLSMDEYRARQSRILSGKSA